MSVTAVVWDVDGTLIDSEPLHHRALGAMGAAVGVDLSDRLETEFVGVSIDKVYEQLCVVAAVNASNETSPPGAFGPGPDDRRLERGAASPRRVERARQGRNTMKKKRDKGR